MISEEEIRLLIYKDGTIEDIEIRFILADTQRIINNYNIFADAPDFSIYINDEEIVMDLLYKIRKCPKWMMNN